VCKIFIAVLGCLLVFANTADAQTLPDFSNKKALFQDSFSKALDTSVWKIELDPKPNSSVYIKDGKLILDTKGGVTVWLNKLLKGNLLIEYDRTVLQTGNENDRVSDLNQFWMAIDPANANLFTRHGVLEEYDAINLYYVGMGGNTNSTTRFRKYEAGNRNLLQEYKDAEHLLQPNTTYHIATIVKDGETSFWVNGKLFFQYKDASPLTQGYFGFRSTKSRQFIDNIQVYQLP